MNLCSSCPFCRYFTEQEAADYLRISKQEIKRLVDSKQLRFKTIGKRRRYRRRDLDALLK